MHSNSVRVELEPITISFVVEGVDDQRKEIIPEEQGALSQNVGVHSVWLGVEHPSADVECIVVVIDADPGRLSRFRILGGRDLMEVLDQGRPLPIGLIQASVDDGGAVRSADGYGLGIGLERQGVLRQGRPKNPEQGNADYRCKQP